MLLRISKLNCCTTERLLPQHFSLFSKSRCWDVIQKLALHGTAVDSSTLVVQGCDSYLTSEVQSHVTQKLGQISEMQPEKFIDIVPSLRITSHLPAHIVKPSTRSHSTPSCMTHQPLETCIPNFIWIVKNFLRTDGRKYYQLRWGVDLVMTIKWLKYSTTTDQ